MVSIRLTRSFVVLLVLVVVALALLLLPVSAARTRLEASTDPHTYHVGMRAGETALIGNRIAVHVEGGGMLTPGLRRALPSSLTQGGGFSDTLVLGALPERADTPILMVEITRTSGIWTPVFARHDVALRASFASDGDTTWRLDEQVVIEAAADPVTRVRIDMEAQVTSLGLLPLRGYERDASQKVADKIAQELAAQLAP